MVATARKKSSDSVRALVDCDKCRHFTGTVGWSTSSWGCAKGHPAEGTSLYHRIDCADYTLASRDERIFRRFKLQAEWYGDESFKTRQTQARRTANSLAKSLAEFGEMMDAEQVEAGKAAVQAMNRLADDLERAARLAKAHKMRKDAEREAERKRCGDALASTVLAGMSDDEVLACASDLASFMNSREADQWLDARHGRRILIGGGLCSVGSGIQAWRQSRTDAQRAEAWGELRRGLAEELQDLARPRKAEYATRADFEAYRLWERDRRGAKAAVSALIAGAQPGGEVD